MLAANTGNKLSKRALTATTFGITFIKIGLSDEITLGTTGEKIIFYLKILPIVSSRHSYYFAQLSGG